MNEKNEENQEVSEVIVESKNQQVKIPMRRQISKKTEKNDKPENEDDVSKLLSQQASVLGIMADKVNHLETILNQVNLPKTGDLLYQIDSFSQFYNDFVNKIEDLTGKLQNEVSYTRTLENQIKLKQSETEVLELKRALEEDRAKISVSLDKIERVLKEGLNSIEVLEEKTLNNLQLQIEGFSGRISELTKFDKTVTECVKAFREDLVDANEREYKALIDKCSKLLDENTSKMEVFKKESISFLKTCEKQNQEIIKKIPKQSEKLCLKDILIYGLCGLNILGWILMWVG